MNYKGTVPALLLSLVLLGSTCYPAAGENDTEVFVAAKSAVLYEEPSVDAKVLAEIPFAEGLYIEGYYDVSAEWIKVQDKDYNLTGYVQSGDIRSDRILQRTTEKSIAAAEGDILDYPGKKDGEVIGELLEYDEVQRTASVGAYWSQIVFRNEEEQETVGYIPTTLLRGYEEDLTESGEMVSTEEEAAAADPEDPEQGGKLREGVGDGVFAEANEGVQPQGGENVYGVQIGTPVTVGENVTLTPLGTFRITHYCPCSICCGPYTDGITSTGVTATTNHTIAVYPSQIPYGSKVVINGQIYVAEDCGGGIKQNCIDIYVATHEEGESKGVFYTDVYLLTEG